MVCGNFHGHNQLMLQWDMDALFCSALTCDVGTLEAVTWQAVGGAVYMQNLAINSVKCLPEPQIRRQDCHHRLKSFKPENQK